MKNIAIKVIGSVVTKDTACDYLRRIIAYFVNDISIEGMKVLDEIEERIVNAGFLSWDEIEKIEVSCY